MSRWFRVYEGLVDDPKWIALGPDLKARLIELWCVCASSNGRLPPIKYLSIKWRIRVDHATRIVQEFIHCGFIDETDQGLVVHNWSVNQYKSDVSTERTKRFRERSRSVPRTPPDTDTDTDTDTEKNTVAKATDTVPVSDARTTLFREGLARVARITGKPPGQCRSLIGRWLRDVQDDCVLLGRVIEDAELNRVADPVAWITRALKPKTASGAKELVREKWRDAVERLEEYANTTGCDPGEKVVGLLPGTGCGEP